MWRCNRNSRILSGVRPPPRGPREPRAARVTLVWEGAQRKWRPCPTGSRPSRRQSAASAPSGGTLRRGQRATAGVAELAVRMGGEGRRDCRRPLWTLGSSGRARRLHVLAGRAGGLSGGHHEPFVKQSRPRVNRARRLRPDVGDARPWAYTAAHFGRYAEQLTPHPSRRPKPHPRARRRCAPPACPQRSSPRRAPRPRHRRRPRA